MPNLDAPHPDKTDARRQAMPLVIDNLPDAIRATKRALQTALPNYRQVFDEVDSAIRQQVDAIRREHDQGRDAIPVFDYSAIVSGDVDQAAIARIKTRGACVVRRVFDPQQASDWNDEIADYVQRNKLDDKLAHRAEDKYFGNLSSSKP
jgi:hypothetical protein